MDDFSFWDQVRACLPCTRPPRLGSDDEGGQGTRDQLDRLLFDSEHEPTDIEVDAMSLHSNVGNGRRRKKKKKRGMGKTVRVFGFDLFGRPRPHEPSPSPSDDETSALHPPSRHMPHQSSSTLDSDAAPLNDSAIATLSQDPTKWAPELTDAQIILEEEEQREKEERKARRAARRLRRQQEAEAEAEAIADQAAGFGPVPLPDPGVFEGFPGATRLVGPDQSLPSPCDDDFGPYVAVQSGGPEEHNHEDSDEADVGGEYNRRSKHSTYSGSGGGSSSRSHSRANGSATGNSATGSSARPSGSRRKAHHPGLNLLQQQQTPYSVPLPPSSAGSRLSFDLEVSPHELAPPKKKKKKSGRSHSSASTSQSPSLPSPQSEEFTQPRVHIQDPSGGHVSEGMINHSGLPSPSTGFPSTGFGGPRVKRTDSLAGQGAALASR